MFKALTKDLAGTADICATVTDFRKLAANEYLLPQEQVLFAFQSAKEEFAFTNEALLTIAGENATTTRKLVTRHAFRDHAIRDVQFETTGRVDRDCEIKFVIGATEVSIDITRKEEQAVKKYYKALVALARDQQQRQRGWAFAHDGVKHAADALRLDGLRLCDNNVKAGSASIDPLSRQATDVLGWLQRDFERLNSRCYRDTITAAIR